MTTDRYPGDHASPYDVNRLADFYRDAAYRSSEAITAGDPMSTGPMRLLAIHSIELNLSAYLLLRGYRWPAIRKMGHDLAARLECATGKGLLLRKRTCAHIHAIGLDREYLVARYGADCISNQQINRLLATLEEVARKVSRAVADAPAMHRPSRPLRPNDDVSQQAMPDHTRALGQGGAGTLPRSRI